MQSDRQEWKRATKYAIQCGPWTITKGYVHGEARYLLWKDKEIVSGPHKTADEAKGKAR
ncbi:hypothetical protein CBM2637_A150008 [Cupriavidus taiwanensis]|nr:hypothetical protein CBM2637_A150008 [Cupriavidus taiwanensis]